MGNGFHIDWDLDFGNRLGAVPCLDCGNGLDVGYAGSCAGPCIDCNPVIDLDADLDHRRDHNIRHHNLRLFPPDNIPGNVGAIDHDYDWHLDCRNTAVDSVPLLFRSAGIGCGGQFCGIGVGAVVVGVGILTVDW